MRLLYISVATAVSLLLAVTSSVDACHNLLTACKLTNATGAVVVERNCTNATAECSGDTVELMNENGDAEFKFTFCGEFNTTKFLVIANKFETWMFFFTFCDGLPIRHKAREDA